MTKLFFRLLFFLFFFGLLFLGFIHKPVMALCAGWNPSTCSCPGQARCTDYGSPGAGSTIAQWCACELMCTGTNTNPACGGGGTQPPSNPSCGALGGDYCSGSSTCPSGYTSLGQTYDCKTCCKRVTQSCGGLGGIYCSGSSSCPSPLVSVGVSYDCKTCCGWSASIPACSAPQPPPCTCGAWINKACGSAGACPVGRRLQTRTCSPFGCASQSQCVVDPACNPSCTMSLSPSSLSVQTGESVILTTNINLINDATIKQVNFTSADSGIAMVNPSSVFSSPYRTNIFGVKAGSTSISGQTLLNPTGSCTAPSPTSVTVEVASWFQTQGGDIYTGASLSNDIPETANNRNLSLKLDNWPGIITHQDENGVSLGSGFPSNDTANYWLAESKYEGKPYGSFQFFKKKFALDLVSETYGQGRGDLPAQDGVYYAQSSRTLSGNWNLGANRWLVLLVEGNVNINTNIIVSKGSFLAIVATGNINFADSVSKAQGMFVADGTIDTGENNQAFEGQGIFASNSFALGRDFDDDRNDTTPAETFIARPDFIMSSYKDTENNLWWFFQKWQEIAP